VAYLDLPIEVDPDVMKDDAIASLQDAFPAWSAAAGNLETILLEIVAEMSAEQAEVASSVPSAIFRQFGSALVGLPPIDGVSAIGSTTWTLTDALGHVIPAGTFISIQGIAFQTSADVTVAVGESTATVPIVAVDTGTDGNGLTGSADLVDTIAYVDSVAVIGATSGGVDAETDDEYLDRLTSELQLMAPRPIIPTDFEVLARNIAGVDRAVAIDGYNPADDTYDNERMVAIAAVDDTGTGVSSTIKDAITAYLESLREVNFVVNAIDPTTTPIDVTATLTLLPGFDSATVLSVVEGAIENFLDPANWGRMTSGDGRYDRPWINMPTVGYLNIARTILMVEGVAFIDTLTVNGGTTDVALSGAAPLTSVGTITVTEA
jgi:hypothetical protein